MKLKLPEHSFSVEHPGDLSHGDFSTNVAMVLGKSAKINPRELAKKILTELNATKPAVIEKIEIAGPGFINFFLTNDFFLKSVSDVVKIEKSGKIYGSNENFKGKKVLVEYTDPNPFKVFHIGHLMSNAIGESISRIIENSGAKVERANYQGDVGLHVAKAMWGILNLIKEKPADGAGITEQVEFIGRAYVLGAGKYEDDEKAKTEITDLNKKIFEKTDAKLNALYDWGRRVSLEHFEEIYAKLGTKFNHYFFESEIAESGVKIVEEFLEKGVFEKSDGAVVFKGENHGVHTRVFLNSQGLPTYEAKELGLNKKKYDLIKPDLSVIVTANEQSDYFKVLLKAISLIYPKIAEITKHVSHGMLRFASGKMGSRKGNVITGESLLNDVEEMVREKIAGRELSSEEKKKIAEQVSVGAIKYSILKQSSGSDIIYDFEKSISFEGDSGPYLQYSFVRAKSILAKAKVEGVVGAEKNGEDGGKGGAGGKGGEGEGISGEISVLEKILYRFPEVVDRAGREFEPHLISTYLVELAGAFNSYYAKNQIVNKDDPGSSYRVLLTEAFSTVLKNGLNLLGIPLPAKM